MWRLCFSALWWKIVGQVENYDHIFVVTETNDTNAANESSGNDTDGNFDASLVCYPSEDIAFRNPETCQIGSLQAERDWDKSSLKVLAAKVTCENFEISQGCNLSQGVIFDRGWPVHEDVASTFWTNGAADWVQLSDDAEESPQDKAPVKERWHGWFDESGDRVMWYKEKGDRSQWTRGETIQGFWRVFSSYVLLLNTRAFREGAALLDAKSRLGRSARRGCAWLERELRLLQDEGQFLDERPDTDEPSFVMHWVGELYPIWVKESNNGFSISSTTFKGFVDADGTEMCLEPVQRPANFQPRRTLLSMRTTHVVQPFLSKIWAHRQLMSAELSVKQLSLAANELWLFHGTRESAAECITENEFQVRMAGSNRGTMFGPGIYLADSVTKSDEYTDPDPTGLRTMILCRCTMGRAIRQEGGGRECMKVCQAGGFHSVKGRRAYNEYIVYDENQVYPEYIIWYRRVYNIEGW